MEINYMIFKFKWQNRSKKETRPLLSNEICLRKRRKIDRETNATSLKLHSAIVLRSFTLNNCFKAISQPHCIQYGYYVFLLFTWSKLWQFRKGLVQKIDFSIYALTHFWKIILKQFPDYTNIKGNRNPYLLDDLLFRPEKTLSQLCRGWSDCRLIFTHKSMKVTWIWIIFRTKPSSEIHA